MTNTQLQTEQVARPSRWPRISLRAWLLLVALVASLGSNLVTAWRLNQSEHDLRKLRDEAGYLTIEDSDQIHVVEWLQTESNVWRWRVFLPEGHKYSLHRRVGEIGRDDFGGAKTFGITSDLLPGEYVVTLRLGPNAEIYLGCKGASGGGDVVSTLSEAEARRCFEGAGGYQMSVTGSSGTQAFSVDKPVPLIRRRATIRPPGGGSVPSDGPTPGVLIWIEKQ